MASRSRPYPSAGQLLHRCARVSPDLVRASKRAAKSAGLRYVSENAPGILRLGTPPRFRYVEAEAHDPRGAGKRPAPHRRVRDPETLARIRALAIPPAWTQVWICKDPQGHIQCVGRDAKKRKQYRYHPRWREQRDAAKYERMLEFGTKLPELRAAVARDLERPGLPREKVIATIVRLLELTSIRVGNEEYARSNHSFGLTTLRNRHVTVEGGTLTFRFRGKSGKVHHVGVHDRRIARIVRRCEELPGQRLFEYVDDAGVTHNIDSNDVNDYIREIAKGEFTAKDFRTLIGTVLAARALREVPVCETKAAQKRAINDTIRHVAERLGNTMAVCRKCYVHPVVIEAFMRGALGASGDLLRDEEAAVMRLVDTQILPALEAGTAAAE